MEILAFNGSPRKNGNTSAIIKAMLRGSRSAGAKTTEIRLHDINMKGCQGCLSCRKRPGRCKQQDDLGPYLEALKTCDGAVFGTPIYMFHVTGQMKTLLIDVTPCISAGPTAQAMILPYRQERRSPWLPLRDIPTWNGFKDPSVGLPP